MNPAKSARLAKERRPQDWCANPRCLWHESRSGPCPKHNRAASDPRLAVNLCLRCHINEPLPEKMLCADCAADRKPEKGSDGWYEMMDNPKSGWRVGE